MTQQDVYLQFTIWLLATKPLWSTFVELPVRVAKRNSGSRDRLKTNKNIFKPYKPNPNFPFELNWGPKMVWTQIGPVFLPNLRWAMVLQMIFALTKILPPRTSQQITGLGTLSPPCHHLNNPTVTRACWWRLRLIFQIHSSAWNWTAVLEILLNDVVGVLTTRDRCGRGYAWS